jgi:hypothetical protein
MMENFIPPKVEFMFPGLKLGEIASALKADTKLQMIQAGWVRSQEWTNVHGYRAPFEALAAYGIALTSFADFVKSRREDFVFA